MPNIEELVSQMRDMSFYPERNMSFYLEQFSIDEACIYIVLLRVV